MVELFLVLVRGGKYRRRAAPQNGYRGELVGLLGCHYLLHFRYSDCSKRLWRYTRLVGHKMDTQKCQ